jgi:hypothetical protein
MSNVDGPSVAGSPADLEEVWVVDPSALLKLSWLPRCEAAFVAASVEGEVASVTVVGDSEGEASVVGVVAGSVTGVEDLVVVAVEGSVAVVVDMKIVTEEGEALVVIEVALVAIEVVTVAALVATVAVLVVTVAVLVATVAVSVVTVVVVSEAVAVASGGEMTLAVASGTRFPASRTILTDVVFAFPEVGVKVVLGMQVGASMMVRKMDLGHLQVVRVGLEDLQVGACQVVATAGTSSEKALVGTTIPENTSDHVISLAW